MHTRKLIQIALELLLKSQVPAVQYIALTTINRLFDIFVYHGLFYPGYYESCYIPLCKRRQQAAKAASDAKAAFQREQQQQQQKNEATNAVNSNTDLDNTNKVVNLQLTKNMNASNQYCKCLGPSCKNYVLHYRTKGKSKKNDKKLKVKDKTYTHRCFKNFLVNVL